MTVQSVRPDRLTRWHGLAAIILGLLGIFVTLDVWKDIASIVFPMDENGHVIVDEEASHIFLVPVVALWLVWVRKVRIRHCRPSFTLLGPILVAAGWGLSSYGFYHNIQYFWHAGAVLLVLGCIIAVLGKNVLFRFFPAILVLVFLIPIPGMFRLNIALPLQAWTAEITHQIAQVVGMETTVSGNMLSINGQDVQVQEACNGLRMVFALILVTYAFAFGMPLRNSVRILILLASPIAALFCNILRTVPTLYIWGYHPSIAQTFHDSAGWVMLPIAFGLLYGIIKILQWAMIPVTPYTLASQS
jgi:exosortase